MYSQIHYQGWPSKFDQTISLMQSKSFPSCFRVESKKKTFQKSQLCNDIEDIEEYRHVGPKLTENITKDILANNKDVMKLNIDSDNVKNRYGRNLTTTSTSSNIKVERKKKTKNVPDRNEWICSVCNSFEDHNDSDLILCDGLCMRSYHIGCLNLSVEDNTQVLTYQYVIVN